MWTAKFVSKQQTTNGLRVVVNFINGTEFIQKDYYMVSPSIDLLKQIVKNEIDALSKRDNFSLTDGQDIDITVVSPPGPTQEDLDRKTYSLDMEKLRKTIELVNFGVFSGTETQIQTLRNKIKAEFQASYLDF